MVTVSMPSLVTVVNPSPPACRGSERQGEQGCGVGQAAGVPLLLLCCCLLLLCCCLLLAAACCCSAAACCCSAAACCCLLLPAAACCCRLLPHRWAVGAGAAPGWPQRPAGPATQRRAGGRHPPPSAPRPHRRTRWPCWWRREPQAARVRSLEPSDRTKSTGGCTSSSWFDLTTSDSWPVRRAPRSKSKHGPAGQLPSRSPGMTGVTSPPHKPPASPEGCRRERQHGAGGRK
jgi:hypothetical protein